MADESKINKPNVGLFRKMRRRRSLEGVRNILAMFPAQEQQTTSPRDRVADNQKDKRSIEEDSMNRSRAVADT
jgi:hypothetical protein